MTFIIIFIIFEINVFEKNNIPFFIFLNRVIIEVKNIQVLNFLFYFNLYNLIFIKIFHIFIED